MPFVDAARRPSLFRGATGRFDAEADGVHYFLAGDATSAESTMLEAVADGISPGEAEALQTTCIRPCMG